MPFPDCICHGWPERRRGEQHQPSVPTAERDLIPANGELPHGSHPALGSQISQPRQTAGVQDGRRAPQPHSKLAVLMRWTGRGSACLCRGEGNGCLPACLQGQGQEEAGPFCSSRRPRSGVEVTYLPGVHFLRPMGTGEGKAASAGSSPLMPGDVGRLVLPNSSTVAQPKATGPHGTHHNHTYSVSTTAPGVWCSNMSGTNHGWDEPQGKGCGGKAWSKGWLQTWSSKCGEEE